MFCAIFQEKTEINKKTMLKLFSDFMAFHVYYHGGRTALAQHMFMYGSAYWTVFLSFKRTGYPS